MRKCCFQLVMMVVALVAVARAGDVAPPAAVVADVAGDAELATRFADLAQLILRQSAINRAHWELAGGLLEGAGRLDPANSRYPRMEVQTMLHIGEYDRARDAIRRYCTLEPQDSAAQAQWIDLYNLHLPSADKRLKYLRPLLTQQSLPAEVRAHAAVRAAEVCLDRADSGPALTFLDEALKLNPLDIDALRIKYRLVGGQISAAQRVEILLGMLRVNPAALPVITNLAGELADAGLVGSSNEMYHHGQLLSIRMGQPLAHDYAMSYCVEAFIAGDGPTMQTLLGAMLGADPGDAGALTMRVLMCRAAGPSAQAVLDQTLQQLITAQFNQIQALRQELGDASATTQDVTNGPPIGWPDYQQDVEKLGQADRQDLRDRYTRVLTSLAWTHIYFLKKPDDAVPALQALKALLPADSADLARLQGWDLLMRNQMQEARVKLSAVAARDALAALGMVRLAAADAAPGSPAAAASVAAGAQELFVSNPSGLIGAVLWDGLRDFHIEALPRHDAERMRRVYDAFPMKPWLSILDAPQTFYSIHASTLKVPYSFAEPIIAQITLQNISDFDIPIGDDAVLRPDLWFDARLRDVAQTQELPGCAYERLGQCLVLHAHTSVTQTVRMDQTPLARALAAEPSPDLQITFSVRTNPSNQPGGNGPAGYTAAFTRAAQRGPFPITSEASLKALLQSLPTATSVQKMRDVDLINDLIGLLMGSPNGQQYQSVAQQLFDAERSLANDPSTAVRSWVSYVTINRITQDARRPLLESMMADPLWTRRALSVLVAGQRPQEEYEKLADQMVATEKDPTVQRLAQGLRELAMQSGAATAPATAPMTTPVTTPSTTPATTPATAP